MKVVSNPLDVVSKDIIDIVGDIGVPTHLLGYKYILYGVHLLKDKLSDNISIVKELYPAISEVFDTTGSRVERGIRHAIDNVLLNQEYSILSKYFANSISAAKGTISNSQFLYTIAHIAHRHELENIK